MTNAHLWWRLTRRLVPSNRVEQNVTNWNISPSFMERAPSTQIYFAFLTSHGTPGSTGFLLLHSLCAAFIPLQVLSDTTVVRGSWVKTARELEIARERLRELSCYMDSKLSYYRVGIFSSRIANPHCREAFTQRYIFLCKGLRESRLPLVTSSSSSFTQSLIHICALTSMLLL